VRRLNIDGDDRVTAGHGGERRLCLSIKWIHRYWQNHLGRNDFVYGQFERTSPSMACRMQRCIGDRYRSAAPCSR
jgi:hypothetical protein